MDIYSSSRVTPYVYICINKETNEFYIGYRELNKVPSNKDLPEYKTSSEIVNPNFKEYDWYIVAEFFSGSDAYNFEQQLIYENWNNKLLLNRSCYYNKKQFKKPKGAKHTKPAWNKGISPSKESNEKRSNALKGKSNSRKGIPLSNEHKKKIGDANKGKENSGQFGKRPPWNKGLKLSDEQKSKMNMDGLKKGQGWNKGIKNE